ncbi:polyhydroxyalkanoate depolymerase [Sandaracinobacter sp. RS1-74]|uniref:polyhydroxyalkanoate depolymerase n=1 Tax=Sandaracinobacteroides sayramensis TaxID=2913411 RepID=UPI001EDBFBE0|nr:polyhydroxyalkanoate depolymerase [Sandaracinobacteroides sayramensis]MCG2840161.1 polyhydroxyalkanoate depolymerase [Sandaracinobacteroides sayramensis]
MLYDAYELGRGWLSGASAAARLGAAWWGSPANPLAYTGAGEVAAAALDVFSHAAAPRGKPPFNLDSTLIDGKPVPVTEEIVDRKPFGQLKRFVRHGAPANDPKLLIVAPMSGHYATLLRGTVERMLPNHDVYITDWRDAKMTPLSEGLFDLDDYIDYLIDWLSVITPPGSPRAHILAVCQPSVPVYAAVCLMSASKHRALPCTLTMMGGPIDTRRAPTAVNELAMQRPHAWFQQNVIAKVPLYYPGGGRKVYPGFLQLAGFMSMNLGNHMISHWEMFKHLVQGDGESADSTKTFYEEYRSVCDMTAEFYLQTIDVVFQRHLLPKGEMMHRGVRVDPGAIADVSILAIEGERDDISGLGQTKAALDLAVNLADDRKRYLMVENVGHYGIFNGRKWREIIAPQQEAFIRANCVDSPPLHGKGAHAEHVDMEPCAGAEFA